LTIRVFRNYYGYMLQFWNKLGEITAEEQEFLDGENIKYSAYHQCERWDNYGNDIEEGLTLQINPRFRQVPLHQHKYLEIFYLYSGKITCNIEGKDIVLSSGDILLMPAGVTHTLEKANFSDIGLCIDIAPTILNALYPTLKDSLVKTFLSNGNSSNYMVFHGETNTPLFNVIENLIFALTQKSEKTLTAKLAFLLFEYLTMDKEYLVFCNVEKNKQNEFRQTLNSYIDTNLTKATLEEFAKIVGYDKEYLSRKIVTVFGKNFKQILVGKRLILAETLLKTTDMNISEIAQSVGYTESSYFYKLFLAEHLITPTEWRKSQKIVGIDED